MSDQPKPPLSVWLGDNVLSPHVGGGEQEQRGTYSTNSKPPYHNGPYVHLDQFMEMVEKIMSKYEWAISREYWDTAFREIENEIKEGKK